ncbi:MAG: SDR family oxidoreductase [Sphingomonas sp.]|uniref:SDR family oxidoreductase n=1 Tax=Sphingomonas sp. TaxID=28214 RepID=UPI003F7F75F4
MKLNEQRVLVIGGASGIGHAVAKAAIADGATVTIASTNADKVQAAAEGLGASSATIDVKDEAGVAAFFAASGAFDHVVTTAGDWGGQRGKSLKDLDLDAARSAFDVRFWGALTLAKHGAFTEHGSLTLTDGTFAHMPMKGSAVSTAAAGAIEHLARALAVELAPVRVNCVCPGLIHTAVWDAVPAERFAAMSAKQLIPRAGTPEEAAEAYLYLMRAGYTTGQVILVEGGSLLGR